MAKKPLQTLYDSLRASNYDVPDNYGSFERTLTAPGTEGVRNRQTLYKALRDNNYDVPDTYESFSRTLFSPVKPTGGTAATGQSMLPADVEERRMRTRNKRETHPLNKSRARQRLQAQQQAIEAQQKRWEQDNKRFKEDIARREQRLPGGMDRFEERAKEQLATGEAAPVPLAPNDEVVRGDIAFNPDTGRMEQTYTTPEGGTFFDRDAAQFDHSLQNMPEDEIEMLERERELIGMGILRRGRELDEEYENQSWWDRFLAGLGTDPEMGPGPRERMAEDDEELQSLLTSWRKNRNALRILYDERNNDMNSFWHNFGTTVANGYTFTGGRAELHDAQAILNSSKRMDEIQRKMKAGEKLSNVENAALSLANNTAWDNAIQAMYGDDYGAWATAGGAAVQSLEMMPEFIAGMPILKGMGTAAINLLTRNAAKGFGRFMLKGLGMTLGTMAGGAIMANTIQAERTLGKAAGNAAGSWWFGDDGEFMLGHYDGDQFVSGGESLAAALFHAEQEAIPEAASEGAGEFLPGIGQVLSKIGLSRIAKPLASLSGKGWYKTYQNMLRAAGWHGVGGEALEEYVGTLDGLIMGDLEGVKRLADPRTHFDIWLSCATLGPLLNAPVVIGSSMRGVYSPVAYHKLKAAVTRQDKIASFRLTEDRWAPWRDRIDNTPNEQMADLMVEIRDDQDLAPQEKKAIFDYVKALQGYRGWNLGEYIFGKDAEEDGEGKSEQEQQQSQEYSNGYETVTPEERRAAKDRLDVARARLGEHRFVAETLDGMSIEEVTDLLNLDTIEDEDRAVLQEYINARTAYDGMLQRVNDDIDDEVAVANEAIDQRIAPEDQGGDGMIHPAVLKGGREVFIISGNVTTLADNSIDVENSDGMIIVRDAEGNEDTISPDNIQSLGEVIDPAQQRQDAEQMIIDEQGQAAAAQIEGQLPFNLGDQYTISYQGEPHTYQVVQADENNVAVLVDGAQEPVVLTRQQLQQMADEERAEQIQAQAAAADAVEEEPAAVEPEQPVEAPAVEEAPAAPVAPEDNPTAAMPMDDQGEPAWDQVEPERGHQFLYQESGWPQAMADNFVQDRIDEAEKALKKAQEAGQKLIYNPKPTFSAQQQAVAENTAAQQAAQSALDYWNGVKAIQAQATAPVVEEAAPVVETPAEQEPTEQAAPVAETEAPAEPVEPEASEPVEETPAVETPAPVAENEMQPVEVEQPDETAPAEPAAESAPQSDAIPGQDATAEQASREEKAANIEAGGAVVDQLQRMGVDVNTDLGEYRKTLSEAKKDKSDAGKVRYLKNSDGTTYGFVYRGKINIDPRKIKAELPLHEYGHLWAEAIRAISPERWQQIVDVLKSDADTWSFLQERRPDLQTDDEIAEEIIAEFSGKNGEAKLKAELERLSKTNSDYKTKWGNIYKNIVKAIQDFWKQVGDFLQIDYTTPQQIYDQVLKDFASGMNPRERVERFLQERDAEFVDAVNRGDMATATRLFNEALTAEVGNGMTPFISVGSHKSSLGNLARKVKRGDKAAIEEVAKLMAPIIPENAVLIPAPSHTGRATYMLDIANAIAKITGSDVADILVGPDRGTQYEQKKATGKAMTSAELGVTVEGELPEGKIPVVLDNVVATGNTAEACVQALGKGIVCSLTKATDQYNHAATLKSANVVVRDANGNVIPLSKRFDLSQSKRLGNIEYQGMPNTLPGNHIELNYESGKDAESRAYIEEVMEREGWDEDAKSEFRKILDDAADLVSRMAQGFTRLREWNNKKLTDEQGNYNPLWRVFDKDDGWIPTRSSFKKNGEYPYNIDLGALCTKREAFDAVVRYIKEQGWGQNLGPTQIEALKSLLREHGFLTACDICFNETRRARALDYGNAVAYYWNAVRQAVGIDDDLPIGTPRELTEEQMKRLTELSKSGKAFSKYVPKELRRTYETYVNTKGQTKRREVDKGLTPTMTRKVAKLFLQDPSLMGKFEGTMVLSTDSVDALVRQFPHTDIARFIAGAWGSNTPKPNEGFNIYDPLSWKQTYDKKRQRPAMDWFFNLGGMRAQSFSDYSPIFFYDYVQMFTDLAIRRLPIHIYTKVPALIKLFGGTGAKFNMSLVPEVVQGVDPEHLGLKPDGNGGWVYAWHEDSFPVDEAFALRQDPRFNGNVGTIAVGISDAHIRMLLDDPTIDMVIPYHKSGMPPSIQVKTGLDKATDYTDDQHSKKRGKALKNDFSFNEALRRLGDPRKAADEYLAWCKENNYTPKYPQFVEHPNYYKVLEDFRCIDNEGNYSPQQPVHMSFFDDVEQRLSESLEDRTMQEGLDTAIRGNDAITEGIKKIMSKPRLDGKIRDMMLARLKQVLGKDNVASLKQEDFFEELQKVYTDQMGAERAQQQVEVLRTSGGIVYGFAVGNRIVLNENYFNAETPMHEFTHVWVKVARLANPQMWAEGKELLKQTKEWQEVMSDEFYRDIQGDEDAVASEVLARIVGQDAARQINEMFAPEDKPQERPGIYNKIKQWVNKFLDGVRSLFDSKAKDLTYDELVRMPMKALFDDAEAARFMEALAQVNEEDVDLSSQGSVPTFYSNAERAVQNVKQNKATAEQWKAMLTKQGGIKAGEDKWMGLSTWLDEHKGETLTKDEVLQFVRDNGIKMEEVHYGEAATKEAFNDFNDEFLDRANNIDADIRQTENLYESHMQRMRAKYGEDYHDKMDSGEAYEERIYKEGLEMLRNDDRFKVAFDLMVQEYGDDFGIAFDWSENGLEIVNDEAASFYLNGNPVNSTRLLYTTEGLENKSEIAFELPDVLPYQEEDEIHFGPENGGRAVMWVRFGETRDTEGNRVLVIDEIQSNRHQDAREKGYADPKAVKAFNDWMDAKAKEFGVQPYQVESRLSDEEYHKMMELANAAKYDEGAVPAAPFEKNWHEVAMKRMLRLAAEEGFDKVAWTTGEQQAERYNIGHAVRSIDWQDNKEMKGKRGKSVIIRSKNGTFDLNLLVDKDGRIIEYYQQYGTYGADFVDKNLSEVVGKEIADKIMSNDGEVREVNLASLHYKSYELRGDGLRIGGEGMKSFYDKMLPQFMNKYGKRWGVKVGEVTLDTPGKEVMHSVDVTPEMRRSVMTEGQPLFQIEKGGETDVRANSAQYNDGTQGDHTRSANFKNWFGDWESDPENASKVVDEEGEPLVMTHNTDQQFTIFDRGRIGSGQGQAYIGLGFNFSRGRNSTYGGNAMEVYLNARNPLQSDGHKLTASMVEQALRKIDEGQEDTTVAEFAGAFVPYGTPEYDRAVRKVARDFVRDYDDLSIYSSISVISSAKADTVIDAFKELGFDSTIERDSEGRIMNAVVFDPNQVKSADEVTFDDEGNEIPEEERYNPDEQDTRYRELDEDEDAELIDRLEKGPHITTYSTKIKVDDGYVPPMSSKDNETGEMRAPEHEQKWNESEERPDLAKQDKKTGKWKFDLKKSNDKDVNGVLYNPYNHSGSGMLNDQFSEAQDRDDLVVVEQVVPQSEETDKYKAEKANDPTGWKAWKAGPITAKMTGKRKVFLSRWHKITRVVPWNEVADAVAKDLGNQFDVLPTNPFPPQLRAELEKKGYKFVKTDNKCVIQEGEYKGATWSERYYDVYPDRAKSKDKREKGARAKAVKEQNASEASRMRSILEDGGTLKVYQSEGKWRVEGVPGEFDTQFGAVDNARNFLQGHVFEVAEDGNSIEVLGAGSNLDNMQSSNKRAEERARKWRERTVANGRRRVEELGQRLGVKVTIVDDMSEQEREGMSKKKRRAKGWYDVRTGEVFINLGNHRTVSDIEATFLHEVVAHKGLRRLFGDEFDKFLHNVYFNVDASIREEINRLMAKNNWDYREATEEYLAKLAQQMNFERPEKYVKAWETVARLFRTLLQKMGLGNGMNLKDSDLQGILFESYHNMEKEGVAGLAESVEFRDWMEREANRRVDNATYQDNTNDTGAAAENNDREYLDAVERGDMEIAEKMVKDAAQRAMPNTKVVDENGMPLVVYHGSGKRFTVFNDGFFTSSKEVADSYTNDGVPLYNTYLNIQNPIIIESPQAWNRIWLTKEEAEKYGIHSTSSVYNGDEVMEDAIREYNEKTGEEWIVTTADDLVDAMKSSDEFDGVIVKDIYGDMNDGSPTDGPHTEYIPKSPTQIKSAEAVTRDNEGNVIPLSERFNPEKEDIRFRDDEDDLEDFDDSEDFYEEELEEEAANPEDLGEEVDDSEAGPSSFQEMMLGKMLQAANSAGAAQSARVSAMRSLGGALQQIRKAMSTQRNYDRETVNTIVRLAREVMASGYFNDLTRGEVKRLLAAAKNANGSANVTEQANKVVDTLLRHHLRECENLLKKQLKVKGSKTNASGVEVQAGLDIEGQRMATAMKQGMRLDDQGLSDRVADCLSRMGSSDPVVAAEASQEWTGLLLAQMYHENIKASRQEEEQMREEMRQAKAEFAARRDSLSPEELKRQRQDLKDYIAATEDAIRQNRMERADAYNQLSEMLGGGIASSMERAKQWRDEQRERVGEIQHNANSDLQDVPADEHMRPTWKHRMANWAVVRFFMKPLATFDYMLRMMGQKSPNGEGYLWNRFMGGWVEANDKEWRNVKAAHQVLDEKVKEVFNADRPGLPKFKLKRWSDLFFIERKMPGMDVDFWDGDQIKRHTLTPGNLLYIYMVNKMSDGKMKLRKMGLSDADVEAIKNHLDPRLIELADWLQDEFLVQKRIEYNAVHERLFGAPMAAIENYFPLKINSRSRSQEEDVNNQDANPDDNRGSTITGAIIKRVRNNKALDVTGADAFDVILEHIQNMEHWAAFAEFNRDLNTLLSYKRFRNRILNMSSARFGSGQKLWTNFKRVCAIASGVYRPKVDYDSVDTNLVNVAKGVTRAKISFRFYTALKQLLSYPAYLSTANPIELIKSSNPVGAVKAWNWAIDNLPGFAERWQSRQAGDTRLKESDADWGLWKSKIIDTASRWGMSPNAFVDALTVAMGAKAIYETKFKQLKKLGYSDEQAKQRAQRDASVAYNETQQSSANAYTSAMQLDRTAASVALTVFRNASMGYQRRLFQSFANLKHMATKGYKEQSLYYLAKQMERDGLDIPTAKAAAEKVYNRALYQNIADVAIFGWVMQAAWNLGAYLPYLFMGDDDDDKKEMLTDAALHAIAGGIEGLTGGSVISDTYNTIRSGEANMYSNELLPLLSDMESLKRTFKKDVIEGANDLVNLIIQAGVGVNPQTITDWVVAGLDVAKGDPRLANEFGLLVMRVMSAPQGQLDKLYIDELGLTAGEAKQLNAEEFAQRYARYKMGRESTFTGWAYSDEGRNDAFDRYVKNFDRKLKERIDAQDIETLADAYDRGDGHMKGLIEKAIKKYVSELDDTALQSMTSNNGNGKITKIVRSEINKRAKAKAAGMTPEEFSEFNKRVKASVANASEEELRDMYNQADTLARKIIRTALDESIDPEVGDPYKSPNKEYGRIYNRIKTADDMEEDILLAKAQKVAKAAGDDDLAKEIASARSELTEYRKELTGGAGDAQVMKELREARKELINEYVKNK